MQRIRRSIITILMVMALIGIIILTDKNDNKVKPLQVGMILPGDIIIYPWMNEEDGVSYYFLPSYVELEDIHLSIGGGKEITINDRLFCDGDELSGLDLNQSYMLSDIDNMKYDIKIMKSGNVSTVFVSTVTGSMDRVLSSKDNKEAARITVLDKDGNININRTDSKIKGRGNSTWDMQPKKPFSIIFEKPESILGMDVSSKWVLLANAFDNSEIRNAIVFDTARKLGLSETSEYEYVDLYLNGVYNGLYMICQSVDTFPERTEVDEKGLFLFTAEMPARIKDMNYTLYAEGGEVLVDVRFPQKMYLKEKENAEKIIDSIDVAIIHGGEYICEAIDLDSWVKKYLIDEIFENYDAGVTSSYFYKTAIDSDSKVYAGPIWDYDNILGNKNAFLGATFDPEILYAKQEFRNKHDRILWYSKLYSNPVFYNAILYTFKNEFLPILDSLIKEDMYTLVKKISVAKSIDDIRWKKEQSEKFDYLVDFLSKRVDFLKKIWLENEEYIEVTYYISDIDSLYYRAYVPKGSALSDNLKVMDELSKSERWYIEGTNEEYDFNRPVEEQIRLVNISDREIKEIDSQTINTGVRGKLIFIGGSLVSMFIVLIFLQFDKRFRRGVR